MKKLLLLCGVFLFFGSTTAQDDSCTCDEPVLSAEDCLLLEVSIDYYYNQGNEALANQYLAIYDKGGCMDVPIEME